MNVSLYEVTQELRELLDSDDSFDPETGELSPALQNAIGAVKNKGASVIAYVLNREAEASLIGDAISKMAARKRAAEKRATALKRYLADGMRVAGIDVIEANDKSFVAKLYVGRDESVEITDESALDAALKTTNTVTTPNKAAIKAAIKAGQPVAGAQIVRRDRLTIS